MNDIDSVDQFVDVAISFKFTGSCKLYKFFPCGRKSPLYINFNAENPEQSFIMEFCSESRSDNTTTYYFFFHNLGQFFYDIINHGVTLFIFLSV